MDGEVRVAREDVDLGNMPPPLGFLHALHGNEIVLSDQTRDEIEGWISRFEQAAIRMEEAAGRMMESSEGHNRAVTRERTGG